MGDYWSKFSGSSDVPVSSQCHTETDTPPHIRFLDDIARYVNLNELRPILVEEDLLKEEDLAADLGKPFNEYSKKEDRKEYLKSLFADPRRCGAFLRCIQKSVVNGRNNYGHDYILTLLDDTYRSGSFTESDVRESKSLRTRMKDRMETMVKSIKPGSALYGQMLVKRLLTSEEFEKFSSNNCTDTDNNKKIFALLEIKGPTAHQLFTQCLCETREEVASHGEIYDSLIGCQDLSISCTSSFPELSHNSLQISTRIDYLKGKE